MMGKRVLLIDDDPDFIRLTGTILKNAGAQVITAQDGIQGISKMYAHQPDLIILDIMMPGISGIEVCHQIRQFMNTPLIITSAMNQDHNELQSLEAGADHFLPKPFDSRILLARARTILRRRGQGNGYQVAFDYDDGHLKIDFKRHSVQIAGERVNLTPVEFRLLGYLVSNASRVITIDRILSNVWGSVYQGNNDYVHVYISHLRSKIEHDPKSPRYILSVHGVGYIFEKQNLAWALSAEHNRMLHPENIEGDS